MTAAIQGLNAWLITNILALLGVLANVLMMLIGYKVRQLLEDRKIPDRLTALETKLEDVKERIENLEAKVFKL